MCKEPPRRTENLVDSFMDDEHWYIILELISGGELFDRIVELERFTEAMAQRCLRACFTALAYVHRHLRSHLPRECAPGGASHGKGKQGPSSKWNAFGD